MENLIVTVTDQYGSFSCDIEIPCKITVRMLIRDLFKSSTDFIPVRFKEPAAMQLFSVRMERILSDNETMESAGIWNGDILFICRI